MFSKFLCIWNRHGLTLDQNNPKSENEKVGAWVDLLHKISKPFNKLTVFIYQVLIYMNTTLSGRLRELKTKEKSRVLKITHIPVLPPLRIDCINNSAIFEFWTSKWQNFNN